LEDFSENLQVLDSIPFRPDLAQIMKMLPTRGDKKHFETMVQALLTVVTPLARPKAVYKVCHIDKRNANSVTIDGVKFASHLLVDKLEKVERVFPFVATCGTEVDSISLPDKDLVKEYCLDVIKTHIVTSAAIYLNKYLTQRFDIAQLSSLNPGEMESWPISQLRNLFLLLGDVRGVIGVSLTENCALVPTKSCSGILFPSETQFHGCQLCPQKRCLGRRTAYNQELAKKYAEKARALS
jgi:hypothetical protein